MVKDISIKKIRRTHQVASRTNVVAELGLRYGKDRRAWTSTNHCLSLSKLVVRGFIRSFAFRGISTDWVGWTLTFRSPR